MSLPFRSRRVSAVPDRDNTIDVYISDDYMDVLADGVWEKLLHNKPEPLSREEKAAWLDTMTGVSLGSDAFFPFGDNIERAAAAACSISHSRAAPSGTTTSSKPATNTESPWPSPASVCSITDPQSNQGAVRRFFSRRPFKRKLEV